jgi:peptidoglycan/xylan/chitin deacetylase (PgdA/CDA1 family)
MIEVAIGAVIVAAVVAAGLAAWRLARGPAQRPLGMAGRAVAVSLVVVPLAFFGSWKLSKARTWQFFGGLVRRVDTTEPLVALTFDDGPTPQHLDEILSLLRQEGVTATFFVTGREVEAHPGEARRIVAEGHELGNHTYSHATMIARSLSFIREEIERTDGLIRAAGYRGDIHFRPPGCKRLLVLPYYLWRTNRKTIIWDVEPESYPDVAAGAGRIVAHVLENARPGSIILLHVMYDSRAETRKALPRIIEGLRDQGYRFVTVSELLAAE